MLAMQSGITMLDSFLHPENAQSPIAVTLPSVGITLVLHPESRVFVAVSMMQLPSLWKTGLFSLTVIFSSPIFRENVRVPILVTVLGMYISLRLSQAENALSPMVVTPSGMTTLVIFLQL